MAPIIDVTGLTKVYGRKRGITDVSFEVTEGEVFGFLGPNGAGKTTVIKTILGVVAMRRRPGRGAISFKGERIDGLAPEEIVGRGIAVVPEGARVFPEMSVLDNLRMGALAGQARAAETRSLAEVFRMFPRLEERQRQLARTLSGGERQMLAIGRALMACPEMVLFDEPSLGLAPILVAQVFQTIREINGQGTTVLLVEQNALQALSIADRGYVLQTGEVVLTGSGESLKQNETVRKAYLGED